VKWRLKPHIFFDDQVSHLAGTSSSTPSVHVPFGKINETDRPVPAEASR
jgi:5'-nucleotidase